MIEMSLPSSFEEFDNLRDAESLEKVDPYYQDIKKTIRWHSESTSLTQTNKGTLIIFFGEPGSGKTLLAMQCLLKLSLSNDLPISTLKLLLHDDVSGEARKMKGVRHEERAPLVVRAYTSYWLERTVYWARENLPPHWVIVTEVPVFPYPVEEKYGDLGGSFVEDTAGLVDINCFGYAVLPNKELQRQSSLERKILEDNTLTAAMVRTDARQTEIAMRQSMGTAQAIIRIETLVNRRMERLIEEGKLPKKLKGFSGNSEKEHEARKYYYRLTAEQFFGEDGNFMVVENPLLSSSSLDLGLYKQIFGHSPNPFSLPITEIISETVTLMDHADEASGASERVRRLLLDYVPEVTN